LVPFLLKIFSLDATFKSFEQCICLKKKAVLVGRIIGGGRGLKKTAKFLA
jgi:hypothetical protein